MNGEKLTVQIVSAQAILHGRATILWHGDVELPEGEGLRPREEWPDEAICEYLFRYFNRVEEEDSDRLNDADFRLPSLSVGDLIHWGKKTWRVDGSGFELLTGSDDYAGALAAYALRSALAPKEGDE
jgi:hypothetical protein